MAKQKRRRGCFGCASIFLLVALISLGFFGFRAYELLVQSNTTNTDDVVLLIPTNASFSQVLDSLASKEILKNEWSFKQTAQLKKYNTSVKSGRYIIKPNTSNNNLVNLLRSGKQSPVRLIINNVRTPQDLAAKVSKQLELDSLSVIQAVQNTSTAEQYGFSMEEFPAMFLANTYEVYWNTSLENFLARMQKEYNTFWNDERTRKAEELGLTPVQVITLASIVEEETKQSSELPIVAGLYLNRLRIGMPLQADPTVKYAVGDFSLTRILNQHLEVDSPYNTYKVTGLPPGPIRIPERNVIEAVLNPANHDYLYMVAKEDLNGYHNFSKSLAEHNRKADLYRKALNRLGIMR